MSAFHKRANMFLMPHAVPINNTQDWYWRMYDEPTYLRKPKPTFERRRAESRAPVVNIGTKRRVKV